MFPNSDNNKCTLYIKHQIDVKSPVQLSQKNWQLITFTNCQLIPGTFTCGAKGLTNAKTKKGSQHIRNVNTTIATVSVAFHSCLAYPEPALINWGIISRHGGFLIKRPLSQMVLISSGRQHEYFSLFFHSKHISRKWNLNVDLFAASQSRSSRYVDLKVYLDWWKSDAKFFTFLLILEETRRRSMHKKLF